MANFSSFPPFSPRSDPTTAPSTVAAAEPTAVRLPAASTQRGERRPAGRANADDNVDCLNLAASVFRFAQSSPDATALVIEDRTYTYAQLAAGAATVAAWLRTQPCDGPRTQPCDGQRTQPCDGPRTQPYDGQRTQLSDQPLTQPCDAPPRVGVLAARSFETYAGILGASWAGSTYVPLNPRQPSPRLASILAQARLSAIVVDTRAAFHLDACEVRAALPAHVLVAGTGAIARDTPHACAWDLLPAAAAHDAPEAVGPQHPAYVMFTSGTTGVPKGVVITAAGVAHFLAAIRNLYGIHPGDRVGQFCEASFDLSVLEMFAAWDGGASLHVVPESLLMAPAGFIRQQQLTVWASVPSVISVLSRLKLLEPAMFPSLRVSVFIGEALTSDSARAWQAAAPNSVVDNHYGPTEATVACTLQRAGDAAAETPGRGTVAIGKSYPGLDADIVDADGRFLAPGQSGELALHGPQLAAGYLEDPALTAERFVVLDHPRLGRTRWYRSGDVAVRDRNDVLHWLGRIDHQVKIMGHRVELEDLEAHLRTASGSDSVAAIAWPVAAGTAASVVAFVCAATASPKDIRERLRGLVPPYMVPRRVVALDALPLSANGKVDRHALRAMLEAKP